MEPVQKGDGPPAREPVATHSHRTHPVTDLPIFAGGDPRKLFVVGCPRSGTTWVQLLLSQHPRVATAPETQIFAYYLSGFRKQWKREHEGPGRAGQGGAGLSRLLSEEEFEELCRLNARMVLERIAARKPGAEVVVEKSPKHALDAEFIHQILPDAYFLHVVRDPRDTAASLLAAGRSWGRGWAPKNAIVAARWWRDHVESARRVRLRTDRYQEVRYETLRGDTTAALREVLDWLGLTESEAGARRMVDRCTLPRLRESAGLAELPLPGELSPPGFFRRGKVGGWRDELSVADRRIVEHVCGDVMRELGYERVATRPRRPLRIALHDGLQRVRESLDWQLERLLYRI